MSQLHIRNLTKRFGDVTALDGVTLSLEGNKIYGLLGRNGAGKTTLLNIIAGRLFATDGQVLVDEKPITENDRALSTLFMSGEFTAHPASMKVADVFRWTNVFYDGAFDLPYALKLCEQFSLNPKKKIRQLSTGYTSIYKAITALSLNVPLLLLDEPVLGLDANHRDLLYRIIAENYAENPRAIIISTHLIEEVAKLIEEVIIIKSGRIIEHAACDDLLAKGYAVTGPAAAVDAFLTGKQEIGGERLGGLKTAYVLGSAEGLSVPETLELTRMDLQKLFIQLTNQ